MERDPKQIVTPFAFKVDPELLGHPLATPKRRMAALLIDLFIAALLTSLESGILLIVLAIYLLHTAYRPAKGVIYRKHTRLAYGISGGILSLLSLVFILNILGIREDNTYSGMDDDDIAEHIDERTRLLLEQQLAAVLADSAGGDSMADAPVDSVDSLAAALQIKVDLYREQLDSLADANEDLREELEEAERPGLVNTTMATAEDFGLTFGWVGFYLVIALAWGGGQTPGKWIMRIKVLRLNGKPLTLWYAFERTGGYAAGLATGLLGFLQIYWDRNRQGIHDKIAGTVVVDLRDKRREAYRELSKKLHEEITD